MQASIAARVCKHGALAGLPLSCPCWFCVQLLLGYLPPDPSEWDEVLARKRTEYFLFCEVGLEGGGGDVPHVGRAHTNHEQ